VRGDDAVLTGLIAAFGIAAVAYYFLSMRGASAAAAEEAASDTWATRTADWFASIFTMDASEKTTGGTTPKEEVDPGDAEK